MSVSNSRREVFAALPGRAVQLRVDRNRLADLAADDTPRAGNLEVLERNVEVSREI